jgi:serine/threonine protein kinase
MTGAGQAEARQIGKYVVKRELTSGAKRVYLAEQPSLGREVVIKQLVVAAGAGGAALSRFMQEAQVMARHSHPNIVQVYDLEQAGNETYLVVEHVAGGSLRDALRQGELPLAQAFAVVHAVLEALDFAQRQNVLHRELKPENVLISDTGQVKVSDFGLARLADDARSSTSTGTGSAAGAAEYISPEQVAGSKVDSRSDLYSVGVMLYELVCGRPPFTASDGDGPFSLMAKHVQAQPPAPRTLRPGIDPELESMILKSLSKRPEDRYRSAQAFDLALERVADRLAPGWQKSAPAAPARAKSHRAAGCLALLGAGGTLLLAAAAGAHSF